jgi:hypothetical protein
MQAGAPPVSYLFKATEMDLYKKYFSGLVCALLCAYQAAAQDAGDEPAGGPAWTFGGYGSLGLVHSSERQADFTENVLNPGRAGYTRRWDADVDSRAAAQLAVQIDPRWSAVVQVITERNLTKDFSPAVEWANVKYQATPDLAIRVGRTALPIFLVGDYRKASYALPWVRPPVEMYSSLPVSNSDGIDLSYRWSAGNVNNTTQISYGAYRTKTSETEWAKARQLTGLSNTTTTGALTLRASVMTTIATVDQVHPLFLAFRAFGPAGAAIADRYDADARRITVANIGFNYDPGAWFLMGELGNMNAHSFLGNKTSAYLSGGYRLGDFTPYATYSLSHSNASIHPAGLPLAGLPPQLAPVAAALNGALDAVVATAPVQHSASLGVRWDFMRDRSLKLQYDRLLPQDGSSGTLINVRPGFQSGHPVNVTSVMLDFVF